jgi:hypothetical protein
MEHGKMKITLTELIGRGACEEERELFFEVFGEEVELPTDLEAQEELAALLTKWDFHIFWTAHNLMESNKYLKWRIFEEEQNRIYYDDMGRRSTEAYKKYIYNSWVYMIQLMVET